MKLRVNDSVENDDLFNVATSRSCGVTFINSALSWDSSEISQIIVIIRCATGLEDCAVAPLMMIITICKEYLLMFWFGLLKETLQQSVHSSHLPVLSTFHSIPSQYWSSYFTFTIWVISKMIKEIHFQPDQPIYIISKWWLVSCECGPVDSLFLSFVKLSRNFINY